MLKRKNTNFIEDEDERSMPAYDVSDPSKRAHIEFAGMSVGTQSKRKQCQDESGLTEQIKRFRITNTPGELRSVHRLNSISYNVVRVLCLMVSSLCNISC